MTKTRYTSGKEYTDRFGNEYIGYIIINDDKRVTDNNGNILSPNDIISTALDVSDFDKDRTPQRILELPNSINDCLLARNDFAIRDVINRKLGRLNDNLLYIYANSMIYKNDNVVSNTYQNLNIFHSFSDVITIDTEYALDPSKPNMQIVIGVNTADNQVYIYKINRDDLSDFEWVVLDQVKHAKNIAYSSTDYRLFATDAYSNSVYSFDIRSIVQEDSVNTLTPVFLNQIGGTGDEEDTESFAEPSLICASDEYVFVYDQPNKCLKIYTHDLIWASTKRKGGSATTRDNTLAKIVWNDGYLYFLYKNGRMIKYTDDDMSIVDDVYFNELLKSNQVGEYKDIQFSRINPYVYYICTEKQIYRAVTTTNEVIGVFYQYDGKTISCCAPSYSNDSKDYLIISFSNPVNNILTTSFNDYWSLVADEYLYFLPLSKFQLSENSDILSSITINCAFYSIMNNLLSLSRTISFLPITGKLSTVSNEQNFTAIEYITDKDRISKNIDFNVLLGINEMATRDAMNRVIKYIYDHQSNLIDIINSRQNTQETTAFNLDLLF